MLEDIQVETPAAELSGTGHDNFQLIVACRGHQRDKSRRAARFGRAILFRERRGAGGAPPSCIARIERDPELTFYFLRQGETECD